MHRRDLASLAAVASIALAIGVGCSEDKPAETKHTGGPAKTPTTGHTSATPTSTSTGAAAPGGKQGALGTATIKGAVNFSGKPVEMKVPKKRKEAEFCKTKEVKYNAVIVNNGKLQDALVRLSNDSVKGEYKAPTSHAVIDQVDCMYSPRIQGVVSGQEIDIKNSDGTLHNVHTFKGSETWFNQAQPKGSAAVTKELEDTKVIKFTCDVHPWMRGFVVVNSHPFFAVSGADGSFKIEKVPAGEYTVEAWHPRYGLKTAKVKVEDGKEATADFSYDGNEKEPDENKDELKDLF
jgi:plastocyanin